MIVGGVPALRVGSAKASPFAERKDDYRPAIDRAMLIRAAFRTWPSLRPPCAVSVCVLQCLRRIHDCRSIPLSAVVPRFVARWHPRICRNHVGPEKVSGIPMSCLIRAPANPLDRDQLAMISFKPSMTCSISSGETAPSFLVNRWTESVRT